MIDFYLMPIIQIPDRYLIPDENSTLRRYLSKEKAIDFLLTGELHFPRVDNFPNKDEIIFSIEDKNWIRNEHKKSGKADWLKNAEEEIASYESFKTHTYINCWNNDNHEIRYLWNTYLNSTNGICIRTTVNKLQIILDRSEESIQMAKIHYYDSISGRTRYFNTIGFFARKIKDDRKDNEVRFILQKLRNSDLPKFVRIKTDINSFDEIIFSPNRDDAFKEEILSIVKERSLTLTFSESKLHNP